MADLSPAPDNLPMPFPTELDLLDWEELADDIFADLQPNEEKFVRAYVASGNAIQAMEASGYSPKSNRPDVLRTEAQDWMADKQQAYRVQRRERVQRALTRWRSFVAQRAALTTEEVIGGLRFIATHDASAIMKPGTMDPKPMSEWPEDHRRTVQKIRIRTYTSSNKDGDILQTSTQVDIEFPDRIKAYENLGRHLELWDSKKKQKGSKYTLVIENAQPQALPSPSHEHTIDLIQAGAFHIERPRLPQPAATDTPLRRGV